MLDRAGNASAASNLGALEFVKRVAQRLPFLGPPADANWTTRLPCLIGSTETVKGARAFTSVTAGFRTCLLSSPNVL